MTKSSQRQPTRMRRKVPSRLSCAKFYISSCKGCSPAAAVGTFSASANKKPERKAEATHGSCTEIKSNLFAVESSNMNILQASRRRRRLCRWLLTFTLRPGRSVVVTLEKLQEFFASFLSHPSSGVFNSTKFEVTHRKNLKL